MTSAAVAHQVALLLWVSCWTAAGCHQTLDQQTDSADVAQHPDCCWHFRLGCRSERGCQSLQQHTGRQQQQCSQVLGQITFNKVHLSQPLE